MKTERFTKAKLPSDTAGQLGFARSGFTRQQQRQTESDRHIHGIAQIRICQISSWVVQLLPARGVKLRNRYGTFSNRLSLAGVQPQSIQWGHTARTPVCM